MKAKFLKILRLALSIIVSILFFTSCTTLSQQSNLLTTFSDENVSATVAVANNFIDLTVENKSNSVITLFVDGSTTTMKSGETSKLIPEGTRYIEANAVQSPLSIAPRGTLKKSFAPASSIAWNEKNATWKISSWVDREKFSLVFPYSIEGNQKHIVIQTSLIEDNNIVGSVEASKTYWHVLWIGSDAYKNELSQMAMEEAISLYGNNIKLVNGSFNGTWSPLSLVLYLNMLGYVENITFTADVQRIE